MAIRYFSDDIPFCLKNKRKITTWIKTIALNEGKKIRNVAFIFVSDEQILEINLKYLKHDYYTDIITFDNSLSDTDISGEMYISINTVKNNANDYNVDFEIELLRVIVHGVLHLCGYKDKTYKQKKKMQSKENQYLKIFLRYILP